MKAKKVFLRAWGSNAKWPFWDYNGSKYRIFIPDSFFDFGNVASKEDKRLIKAKDGKYIHNRTGVIYDSLSET